MNPYLFIMGCLRSATTLLRRMVDAHPDIAIIHETHCIPRLYEKRTGLTSEGAVTTQLIAKFLDDRRFSKLGVSRRDLEDLMSSDGAISYVDYISRVFDLC